MSEQHILIGKITGLFGIAGWVKVHSYTRPWQNIITYPAWRVVVSEDASGALLEPVLESARRHLGGSIAKFEGVDDRNAAAALLGCSLTIEEAQLASLPHDEYYWFQLLGLGVVNTEGEVLGVVKRLLETGANDVLVVEGEGGSYLIPYVDGDYVKAVNLEKRQMKVDWKVEWQT